MFTSYITFLSRNKVYTLINVFGLSISLMFVALICLYTQQEYAIDKAHSKADRIYSVGTITTHDGETHTFDCAHWRLQEHLRKRYPEIEATCAFRNNNLYANLPSGEKLETKVLFADKNFFELFDFQILEGDKLHLLENSSDVVVTKAYARRLFGNTDPLGKSIVFQDTLRLRISGVVETLGGSSIVPCDVAMRYEYTNLVSSSYTDDRMSNALSAQVVLLTKPGSNLPSKIDDMTRFFKQIYWFYQMPGNDAKANLLPFNQIYFSGTDSPEAITARGDRTLVNILFVVGIVILLFSIINYINLTVAQSGRRAKEMATRRLLGSSRKDIVLRLISESLLLCCIAIVVALTLAFLFAPAAGKLLNTQINVAAAFKPLNLCIGILFLAFTGILSGILPALYISRAKPIDVVRGTFRMQTKMTFGKLFIIFQSAVTIVLLAVSLTMTLQIKHLLNAPLGYSTKNLVNIPNCTDDTLKIKTFLAELKRLPFVEDATACMGTPLQRGNNYTMNINNKTISFQQLVGDKSYLKVFGLEVEQDNRIADPNGVFLNKQALAEMGLTAAARSIDFQQFGGKHPIRGILKDFRLGTITDGQSPIRFVQVDNGAFVPWEYVVKVTGDAVENYQSIQALYKKIFKLDLNEENPYVDQQLRKHFEQEIRISTIISLFAAIAIVISFLGLVAMSTYFIEQRNREIALRKVFGSSNRRVLTALIGTFLRYIVIAFVLAIAPIWWLMAPWLSHYSYRIALSPWIFLAAGGACLLLSFLTVFAQSYIAANTNPVHALKEE